MSCPTLEYACTRFRSGSHAQPGRSCRLGLTEQFPLLLAPCLDQFSPYKNLLLLRCRHCYRNAKVAKYNDKAILQGIKLVPYRLSFVFMGSTFTAALLSSGFLEGFRRAALLRARLRRKKGDALVSFPAVETAGYCQSSPAGTWVGVGATWEELPEAASRATNSRSPSARPRSYRRAVPLRMTNT